MKFAVASLAFAATAYGASVSINSVVVFPDGVST